MSLSSLWRRVQTHVLIGVASLGGAALAVAAMNAVDSPRPSPLWTEADLPPLPPDADNGWHTALAADALRPRRCSDTRRGSRKARSDHDADAAVDRVLAGTHTPAATLTDLDVVADDARPFRDACREAFARPRFMDACEPGGDCRVLAVHRCHRAMLHEAVLALGKGDEKRAVDLTADMLRARLDHLATARSVISHRVAAKNVGDLFQLAALVANEVPMSQSRLGRLVAAYPSELPPAKFADIGEYLSMAATIDDVMSGEHGLIMRLLMDPGETLSMLEDRAKGHTTRPTDEIGWWVDNAAGDLFIDMTFHELDLSRSSGEYEIARSAAQLATRPSPRATRARGPHDEEARAQRLRPHHPRGARGVDADRPGRRPPPRGGWGDARDPNPPAGRAGGGRLGARGVLRDR